MKTFKSEEEQVLSTMFASLLPLRLKKIPAKQKKKLIVLRKIVEQLQAERVYTEKELNEVITVIYPDYAAIRRYLVDFGFMERRKDGGEYWVAKQQPGMEG